MRSVECRSVGAATGFSLAAENSCRTPAPAVTSPRDPSSWRRGSGLELVNGWVERCMVLSFLRQWKPVRQPGKRRVVDRTICWHEVVPRASGWLASSLMFFSASQTPDVAGLTLLSTSLIVGKTHSCGWERRLSGDPRIAKVSPVGQDKRCRSVTGDAAWGPGATSGSAGGNKVPIMGDWCSENQKRVGASCRTYS